MTITAECLLFGVLTVDDTGEDRDKCEVVTNDILNAVTKPDQDALNDLCGSLCADCGCAYVEKVFDGDFTPIYVEQQVSTDIITFEVLKSDGTGQIIVDQSLGVFVANTSYNADWELIRALFGGGTYTIIIHYDVLGILNDVESHKFQLTTFNECTADGNVKFQWTTSGSVRDGRVFDPARTYETRLAGRMIEETPEEEEETYQTNARVIKTIQKTIKRIYKFKSFPLQYAQKEMIIEQMAIADSFIVTDLNVNVKPFVNKSVKLENISNIEDKEGSAYYIIELAFTDLKQDLIKRPC